MNNTPPLLNATFALLDDAHKNVFFSFLSATKAFLLWVFGVFGYPLTLVVGPENHQLHTGAVVLSGMSIILMVFMVRNVDHARTFSEYSLILALL